MGKGAKMDLTAVVEYIQVALATGDTAKGKDTNYRMRLYSRDNQIMAHQRWNGGGGPSGEWIGNGTRYERGPNDPPWGNDLGEWRATHGNAAPTLENLRGGLLEIEIGSDPDTDHWTLKAVVWAKLQGNDNRVALSPDPGGYVGIASDGHNNWPNSASFPLSLIV
jgi:hypothetical protein